MRKCCKRCKRNRKGENQEQSSTLDKETNVIQIMGIHCEQPEPETSFQKMMKFILENFQHLKTMMEQQNDKMKTYI